MAKGGFHTTIVYNNYIAISEKQAELIKIGLTKILIEAKAEAKSLVRIDTTTLQKSISYRHVSKLIFELYTNVEYAVYQEFGFVHHKSGNFVYPQPFMFPAAVNAGAKIDAMVGGILTQVW